MPDYPACICVEDYPQAYSFALRPVLFLYLCLGTLTLKHALCSSGYASSFIAYSPLSKQKAQARVIPVLFPLTHKKNNSGDILLFTLAIVSYALFFSRRQASNPHRLLSPNRSSILKLLRHIITPLNGRGKPRINALS